ncbi:MAG: ATP-grasp domain-containing protein [Methanotrichaceae archaeon]|nr:ATP-grasp domain-containing protein [Methanotrichaceae archaeon]
MAKKLNIPIPKTILLEDIDDIYKIAEKLRYPVVVKPRQSVTFISDKAMVCNTKYVFSKGELISNYISLHKKIPYPLIQEYIQGEEIGVFLLLNRGALNAVFSHRRIRSTNPLGGVSCMRESVKINSMMKFFAVKLLEEINWNGIAMVEFKIDSSDNIPKLMEINGRFWGSLQLAIISGVDFPYLLLKTLMGETISPVLDYRKGIKCRDLYGDFIHFYNVLMRPDKRFEYPEKFFTARQFIKFNERNLYYDSISLEDPKLTLKTFWDIMKLPYLHKTKKKGNYEIN